MPASEECTGLGEKIASTYRLVCINVQNTILPFDPVFLWSLKSGPQPVLMTGHHHLQRSAESHSNKVWGKTKQYYKKERPHEYNFKKITCGPGQHF